MREKQKKFVTVDSLERKNLSKSFKLPFMYFNQILKNLVDDDQQRGFLFSRIVESIYVWGPRERTSRKFFLIYSLISRIDVWRRGRCYLEGSERAQGPYGSTRQLE